MLLDLVLTVGGQHETVSVSGATEMLKTQDASLGEVVEQRGIRRPSSERANAARSRADGARRPCTVTERKRA